MKNLLLISVMLLTCSLLSSCLKESVPKGQNGGSTSNTKNNTGDTVKTGPIVPISPGLLAGDWQVINDTSTIVPWGLWEGKPTIGQNYVGKPTDYYKFTANGNAYTNIAGVVDTANYTISQDTLHVVYTYFNQQESTTGIYNSFWAVTNLTAHTATVTATFVTPETAITSVTYLRK